MSKFSAVVFDIGGTLMEYKNMPYVWFDYYDAAFREINKKLDLNLSEAELVHSLEVLKSYNPGVNYREVDYPPEKIFGDVTAQWKTDVPLCTIIDEFFGAMHLESLIYPESEAVLKELRRRDLIIGTYTNVVSGMPDKMHRSYFESLMPYFDIYVSSVTCGYRKPHPRGLEIISGMFGVEPKEMLFVGDEKKDPMTAKRFGCKSVLINRSDEVRDFGQDYTVKDLREILAIL